MTDAKQHTEHVAVLRDYLGLAERMRREPTPDVRRCLDALDSLEEQLETLHNGCEQALLLLERERFADDSEAKVVRAVLKGALASSPASVSEDEIEGWKAEQDAASRPAKDPSA